MRPVRDAQDTLVRRTDAAEIALDHVSRADAVVVGTKEIDGHAKIGRQTAQIKFHAQILDQGGLVCKISVPQQDLPQLPAQIAQVAIGREQSRTEIGRERLAGAVFPVRAGRITQGGIRKKSRQMITFIFITTGF